jgi:hypothetical protein
MELALGDGSSPLSPALVALASSRNRKRYVVGARDLRAPRRWPVQQFVSAEIVSAVCRAGLRRSVGRFPKYRVFQSRP